MTPALHERARIATLLAERWRVLRRADADVLEAWAAACRRAVR